MERIQNTNKCRCQCEEGHIPVGSDCFKVIYAIERTAVVSFGILSDWNRESDWNRKLYLCRLAGGDLLNSTEWKQFRAFLSSSLYTNPQRDSGSVFCKQYYHGKHACQTNNCSINAKCSFSAYSDSAVKETNITGLCECTNGFYGDGHTYNDINECTTNTHTCLGNQNCTNTQGSYKCD